MKSMEDSVNHFCEKCTYLLLLTELKCSDFQFPPLEEFDCEIQMIKFDAKYCATSRQVHRLYTAQIECPRMWLTLTEAQTHSWIWIDCWVVFVKNIDFCPQKVRNNFDWLLWLRYSNDLFGIFSSFFHWIIEFWTKTVDFKNCVNSIWKSRSDSFIFSINFPFMLIVTPAIKPADDFWQIRSAGIVEIFP